MLFSKSSEYAIRAMTFLAQQPAGKLAGGREIAEAEGIPMPYLWKILQTLTRRKLIRSFKGQRGGYELAQPADQISVLAVMQATDDDQRLTSCVLGMAHCGEETACSMHHMWKEIRGQVCTLLEQSTLADLAEAAQQRATRQTRKTARKAS